MIRRVVGEPVNELTEKITAWEAGSHRGMWTVLQGNHHGLGLGFLIISASVLWLSSVLFDFPLALSPFASRNQYLQNCSHQAV